MVLKTCFPISWKKCQPQKKYFAFAYILQEKHGDSGGGDGSHGLADAMLGWVDTATLYSQTDSGHAG